MQTHIAALLAWHGYIHNQSIVRQCDGINTTPSQCALVQGDSSNAANKTQLCYLMYLYLCSHDVVCVGSQYYSHFVHLLRDC